jgi:hypothetical protein
MFFDDPRNALSVARTHQRALVHQEQRDSVARQVQPERMGLSSAGRMSRWKTLRGVGLWLNACMARCAAILTLERPQLPG